MLKRSMHRWSVVGDLMISFTTEGPIDNDVWTQFLNDLKTKPVKKYLSMAMGNVEATSVQRKMNIEVTRSRKIPVAVVTDERLVRGMVTAASWLGVDIKAFDWDEVKEALDYLQVSHLMDERVRQTIEDLKKACST